jgi:hypothetical protein
VAEAAAGSNEIAENIAPVAAGAASSELVGHMGASTTSLTEMAADLGGLLSDFTY